MAKLRSLLTLAGCLLAAALLRLLRGPRRPGWPWTLDAFTRFLRAQLRHAARLPTPALQRAYLGALKVPTPALDRLRVTPVRAGTAAARWFEPPELRSDATLLYLHGGGFAFEGPPQDNLTALVALASGARTLAVDYRLTPEHPFPAALDDARAAYRHLLETGVAASQTAVAGDSAGGGLALALLLSLRDAGEPLPAMAALLCPWVDMADDSEVPPGVTADWIDPRVVGVWRDGYLNGRDPADPLVSPLRADLRGLPPLYLQAGGAEVLVQQVRALADKAVSQGVETTLDEWPHMNHVFQGFGPALPESREALVRLGQAIREKTGPSTSPAPCPSPRE